MGRDVSGLGTWTHIFSPLILWRTKAQHGSRSEQINAHPTFKARWSRTVALDFPTTPLSMMASKRWATANVLKLAAMTGWAWLADDSQSSTSAVESSSPTEIVNLLEAR